ncbi:putative autophagy protein 4 [Paratrimastix pyriformis]|uniref:Cysteine protease n=1 Tax=Paratrimastix pyriformis TaxID=342808 RepID=A0ABQ8UVM6_9EUKA|nr:putative autophagy protein 4 [Paratrimastix pyriformis]
MLRTGQMLLGEAFSREYLGRDWRYRPDEYRCKWILRLFSESAAPRLQIPGPFSLQAIAHRGASYDKPIGQWFAPSNVANVLRDLVMSLSPDPVRFAVYTSNDGVIYRDQHATLPSTRHDMGLQAAPLPPVPLPPSPLSRSPSDRTPSTSSRSTTPPPPPPSPTAKSQLASGGWDRSVVSLDMLDRPVLPPPPVKTTYTLADSPLFRPAAPAAPAAPAQRQQQQQEEEKTALLAGVTSAPAMREPGPPCECSRRKRPSPTVTEDEPVLLNHEDARPARRHPAHEPPPSPSAEASRGVVVVTMDPDQPPPTSTPPLPAAAPAPAPGPASLFPAGTPVYRTTCGMLAGGMLGTGTTLVLPRPAALRPSEAPVAQPVRFTTRALSDEEVDEELSSTQSSDEPPPLSAPAGPAAPASAPAMDGSAVLVPAAPRSAGSGTPPDSPDALAPFFLPDEDQPPSQQQPSPALSVPGPPPQQRSQSQGTSPAQQSSISPSSFASRTPPTISSSFGASAPAGGEGGLAAPGSPTLLTELPRPLSPGWRPLIILLPVRCGLEHINQPPIATTRPRLTWSLSFSPMVSSPPPTATQLYVQTLQEVLAMPQSLGISGGKPRSSYWFIGYQDKQLIYLDPHYTQGSIPMDQDLAFSDTISFADIDTSMCLGFLCHDEAEFEDLCLRVNKLSGLFSVSDVTPEYMLPFPTPELGLHLAPQAPPQTEALAQTLRDPAGVPLHYCVRPPLSPPLAAPAAPPSPSATRLVERVEQIAPEAFLAII